MSIQEKREQMLSLVSDWKASGLTQKTFSVLHNIGMAKLCYWVARSKEADTSANSFVEVSDRVPSGDGQIEFIYQTGVRLKVGQDLDLIAQLIRL